MYGETDSPPYDNYLVSYKEEEGDKGTWFFLCFADDPDHAEEQCLNAYPDCVILNITSLQYPDQKENQNEK